MKTKRVISLILVIVLTLGLSINADAFVYNFRYANFSTVAGNFRNNSGVTKYTDGQYNSNSKDIAHFGSKTLAEVYGIGANDIVTMLNRHLNDDFLLNTPYCKGDYVTANGYGRAVGKTPGMNCGGFIGYVLTATKRGDDFTDTQEKMDLAKKLYYYAVYNDASANTALRGASYYGDLCVKNDIECYVFADGYGSSCTQKMIDSGLAEKGDIMLYFSNGGWGDNHIGFYFGDYKGYPNTFWHSAGFVAGDTVLAGTNGANRISAKPVPLCGANTLILIKTGYTNPTAPTNVSVTASSYRKIKVSWKSDYPNERYKVYRSLSPSGKFTYLGTTTSCTYYDSTVKLGNKYYYKVKAVNKGLSSPYSSVSKGISPKLGTVSDAKASSKSYNKIRITWKKVSGASGYQIYRKNEKTGTSAIIKKITSADTLYYTDTVTSGRNYTYKVRAYRKESSGTYYGSYSLPTTAKAPIGTTAYTKITSTGSNNVTLRWEKANGATGYQILRSEQKDSGYKCVKNIYSADTLTFSDNTVEFGKYYYYKVKPFNKDNTSVAFGPSKRSWKVRARIDAPELKLTKLAVDKVKLSWNKVLYAKYYSIDVKYPGDTEFTHLRNVSASTLSFTDSKAKSGSFYRVKAYRIENGNNIYGLGAYRKFY
ncbi:MAG: hypothetical protein Q4C42_04825 [Clostridia bacterium]|nr:hypothetical protein [Clostridia bacterium]